MGEVILNADAVELPDEDLPLLEWLRYRGLIAAKPVCLGGDCGACQVLVGGVEHGSSEVRYRAMNSCLLTTGLVEGRQIVTVEGLNGDNLTPVQQALVDAGAIQCGYCTPGFVIALTGALLNRVPPLGAASGNLCRCTGYGGLLRAVDRLDARFPDGLGTYALPADVVSAATALQPRQRPVGGHTDAALHPRDRTVPVSRAADPGPALRTVTDCGDQIMIGAGVTVAELISDPLLREAWPSPAPHLDLFGSPAVREAATVGGNLANASPAADLAVVLLALGAGLSLHGGAWADCDTIVKGEVSVGSAEHVAFETQCALVVPTGTGLLVHSATQAPSAVQAVVARVTGLRMHDVEVEVPRLGGGFGSKEEQANQWAALAALAACRTGRPVRVCLDRTEDARLTGKRHPYDASFRLGLDASGRFIAYEARLRQTAGAVPDLSPAIQERSLFHATNAYAIGNVRVTAESRRTNLPPNTAFRGFGAPQAIFVVEAAIRKAAHALGVRPEELQARNLLSNGDKFPYGQVVTGARGRQTWAALVARRSPADLRTEIDDHNATNPRVRRGMAVVPVCFGIAFTARVLNQAEALVHVYVDGSVSVTTGAIEMGQGVAGKIRTVVAPTLGVDESAVRVDSTNTTRTANVSPTAASTGADLNGAAAREACLAILSNLPDGPGDWLDRVHVAYDRRRSLSALAHVAMPGLTRGTPFRYHVFGAALVEAEVDVLLGIGRIVRVTIAHDCGESLDEMTDRGQIEGAVVQGIGWMTTEEVVRDASGRLLTDSLTTYKIPDVADAPELDVQLLQSPNPVGLLGSKAVGEPPLVYGLGAFFALQDAIASYNPAAASRFTTPLTSERIFSLLHGVKDA